MRFIKSFLFIFHLQVILDVFFLGLNHIGVHVLSFFSGTWLLQLSLYTLILLFVYLGTAWVASMFFPAQKDYPAKAGIWFGLMFLTYSVLFALAQNDPFFWTIYLSVNFPLGIAYRSLLASDFSLALQFLPILSTLMAYLGLKFGFSLSSWFQTKQKKRRGQV